MVVSGVPPYSSGDMQFSLPNVNAAGAIMGGGTSALPLTSSTVNATFGYFYTKCTATSGTSYGLYWRHYVGGAGQEGSAMRAFTSVLDVAAANAHGIHASVSFGSSGSVTGEAIATRATLQVVNGTMTAGTYSAVQSEIWCDGVSSDPSGVTELNMFRVVFSGNATGLAKADTKANLFSLQGNTIGSGKMMCAKSSAAVTHVLRILVGSTNYYLMVATVI